MNGENSYDFTDETIEEVVENEEQFVQNKFVVSKETVSTNLLHLTRQQHSLALQQISDMIVCHLNGYKESRVSQNNEFDVNNRYETLFPVFNAKSYVFDIGPREKTLYRALKETWNDGNANIRNFASYLQDLQSAIGTRNMYDVIRSFEDVSKDTSITGYSHVSDTDAYILTNTSSNTLSIRRLLASSSNQGDIVRLAGILRRNNNDIKAISISKLRTFCFKDFFTMLHNIQIGDEVNAFPHEYIEGVSSDGNTRAISYKVTHVDHSSVILENESSSLLYNKHAISSNPFTIYPISVQDPITRYNAIKMDILYLFDDTQSIQEQIDFAKTSRNIYLFSIFKSLKSITPKTLHRVLKLAECDHVELNPITQSLIHLIYSNARGSTVAPKWIPVEYKSDSSSIPSILKKAHFPYNDSFVDSSMGRMEYITHSHDGGLLELSKYAIDQAEKQMEWLTKNKVAAMDYELKTLSEPASGKQKISAIKIHKVVEQEGINLRRFKYLHDLIEETSIAQKTEYGVVNQNTFVQKTAGTTKWVLIPLNNILPRTWLTQYQQNPYNNTLYDKQAFDDWVSNIVYEYQKKNKQLWKNPYDRLNKIKNHFVDDITRFIKLRDSRSFWVPESHEMFVDAYKDKWIKDNDQNVELNIEIDNAVEELDVNTFESNESGTGSLNNLLQSPISELLTTLLQLTSFKLSQNEKQLALQYLDRKHNKERKIQAKYELLLVKRIAIVQDKLKQIVDAGIKNEKLQKFVSKVNNDTQVELSNALLKNKKKTIISVFALFVVFSMANRPKQVFSPLSICVPKMKSSDVNYFIKYFGCALVQFAKLTADKSILKEYCEELNGKGKQYKSNVDAIETRYEKLLKKESVFRDLISKSEQRLSRLNNIKLTTSWPSYRPFVYIRSHEERDSLGSNSNSVNTRIKASKSKSNVVVDVASQTKIHVSSASAINIVSMYISLLNKHVASANKSTFSAINKNAHIATSCCQEHFATFGELWNSLDPKIVAFFAKLRKEGLFNTPVLFMQESKKHRPRNGGMYWYDLIGNSIPIQSTNPIKRLSTQNRYGYEYLRSFMISNDVFKSNEILLDITGTGVNPVNSSTSVLFGDVTKVIHEMFPQNQKIKGLQTKNHKSTTEKWQAVRSKLEKQTSQLHTFVGIRFLENVISDINILVNRVLYSYKTDITAITKKKYIDTNMKAKLINALEQDQAYYHIDIQSESYKLFHEGMKSITLKDLHVLFGHNVQSIGDAKSTYVLLMYIFITVLHILFHRVLQNTNTSGNAHQTQINLRSYNAVQSNIVQKFVNKVYSICERRFDESFVDVFRLEQEFNTARERKKQDEARKRAQLYQDEMTIYDITLNSMLEPDDVEYSYQDDANMGYTRDELYTSDDVLGYNEYDLNPNGEDDYNYGGFDG